LIIQIIGLFPDFSREATKTWKLRHFSKSKYLGKLQAQVVQSLRKIGGKRFWIIFD
jgi:hypothetical protein